MMYEFINLVFEKETRKSNIVNMVMTKLLATERFDYAAKLGEWYLRKLNADKFKADVYTSSILFNLNLVYLMRGQLKERIELSREISRLPQHLLDKVSRNLCSQAILYAEFMLGDWSSVSNRLHKLERELNYFRKNPLTVLIHEEDKSNEDSLDNVKHLIDLGLVACYYKIGYVNLIMRRYSRVEKHYAKALSISRSLNGYRHPDNTCYQLGLAELYLAQGRYEEAKKIVEEVLLIRKKFFSARSTEMANTYLIRGKLHLVDGELNEAKKCFSRVEKTYRRLSKEFQYVDMAFLFEARAALEYKKGRFKACLKLVDEAISCFETTFAPGHLFTLDSLEIKSRCLKELGQTEESMKLKSKISKLAKSASIRETSHEFMLDEAA